MSDLLYIGLVMSFFILTWGFVALSNSHLEIRTAVVFVARSISSENGKFHLWSNLPIRSQHENRHSGKTGIDTDFNAGNDMSDFLYLGVFLSFFGLAWGLVELCQLLLVK